MEASGSWARPLGLLHWALAPSPRGLRPWLPEGRAVWNSCCDCGPKPLPRPFLTLMAPTIDVRQVLG